VLRDLFTYRRSPPPRGPVGGRLAPGLCDTAMQDRDGS
jgi:hypothetical protein